MLNQRQRKGTIPGCLWLAGTFCLLLGACNGPPMRSSQSPPAAVLSLAEGQTLAAIGVKPPSKTDSAAEEGAWRDRRVAFGFNSLLTEAFYDTGKFRLVEEKDLRQRQLIQDLVELFWSGSPPELADPEMENIATRLESNLLAYGTLSYTWLSGQRRQIGPFGSYQQKLRINIEVCLYEVPTRQTLCRQGEGMAEQEGMGVGYEFRNDRLEFEKSATGRATKQAVTNAVQALVASIRFSR